MQYGRVERLRVSITTTLCVFLLIHSTACSAIMAASGEKNPDLSILEIGATRAAVELQIGDPVSYEQLADGYVGVYEFEIGDEPGAGRAVGHGIMFILTLGLWELFYTPMEATRGDDKEVAVLYDRNEIVVDIRRPQSEVD